MWALECTFLNGILAKLMVTCDMLAQISDILLWSLTRVAAVANGIFDVGFLFSRGGNALEAIRHLVRIPFGVELVNILHPNQQINQSVLGNGICG